MIEKILLIDDDVEEHDIFSKAVKEIGKEFSVMAMDNPGLALKALKTFSLNPDIIFLELYMPGMTAEDFLFALESCEHLQAIPIIIYTASPIPGYISPGWPGVKCCINKPHSFSELIECLGKFLRPQAR